MTLESDPELDEPTLTHPNLYRSQVLDYILNRRFGDIMLDYRGMVRVEESGSYLSPVGKGQLFFSGTQLFYDGEFLADRASGYGRYFYANGNVLYAGEVLDDKWFGEGTQYHILGSSPLPKFFFRLQDLRRLIHGDEIQRTRQTLPRVFLPAPLCRELLERASPRRR